MSKSKIIPQEKPAEKKAPVLKRIFAADAGLLRAPWLLLIGCAAYLLWNRGISWGLGAAFSALFDLWGVNAANLHLAPAWARVVVNHYGSAVSLVSSAGVIAIAVLLCRFGLREKLSTFARAEPDVARRDVASHVEDLHASQAGLGDLLEVARDAFLRDVAVHEVVPRLRLRGVGRTAEPALQRKRPAGGQVAHGRCGQNSSKDFHAHCITPFL